MAAMDPSLVARLASGEGHALLASLPPYDESTALATQVRLRADGWDASLVAAALTQSRLRARAVAKFGDVAGRLLLTADGLEQSTRLPLARRHAGRYAAAHVALVHDLGCGLGIDALSLCEAGVAVRAVDADPVTAALAAHNLAPWPIASVTCARAEDVEVTVADQSVDGMAGVWLDPARRVLGVADVRGRTKRVFSLDAMSPSWQHVLERAAAVPATGAKLSPAFPHRAVPTGAEAQWTSWQGEVLECAVWWGPLVQSAGRSAAVCAPGSEVVVTEAEASIADGVDPVASLEGVGRVGDWLYEADRAIVRAGLTGALVAAVDGRELTPGVGYVASPAAYELAWAKRFRVVEAMPLSPKPLTIWLRDHGHDRITIKKRGVNVDPEALRRRLKLARPGRRGGSEATLVLTRVGAAQVALVVTPA